MLGIKLEDKDKIIDYCINRCIEKDHALYNIRTNIIHINSEQVNITDGSIIFTGLLYYPSSNDSDIILSNYELQINNKLVVFNLKYIILNNEESDKKDIWSNAIIKNVSLNYFVDELSKSMGYTKDNKLLSTLEKEI